MSTDPGSSGTPSDRAIGILAAVICLVIVFLAVWTGGQLLVAPSTAAQETLFRSILSATGQLPLVSGLPGLTAFNVVVIVAVTVLFIASYRQLSVMLPKKGYLGRAIKAFLLLALASCLLNFRMKSSMGMPFALIYSGVLFVVIWQSQRIAATRRVVEAVFWVGLGFLTLSGLVLPLTRDFTRYDLQRYHGIFGYLWFSLLGVYLIAHVIYYESKHETPSRNWGYLAALILALAVLTGVARMAGGGEEEPQSVWAHGITAVLALVGIGFHVGRSWLKQGFAPAELAGLPAKFVLILVAAGMALTGLPHLVHHPPDEWGRTQGASVEQATELLANPITGVSVSGPGGSLLPAASVGVRYAPVGCGKLTGCHVDLQDQWERSGHRFTAYAAYRQSVRILVKQEGIKAARFCASCHDPVPLLAGKIVAGASYPFENSEGVTCVVCHSMKPPAKLGNGHYSVEPSPLFMRSVNDAFSSYMMVKLYKEEHDDELDGPAVRDGTICGPCHNLAVAGHAFRLTFDEWEHGPFGPGKKPEESCVECHMPFAGRSYLGMFDYHDHRLRGSNIAFAGLRGAAPDPERAFIAAAINLEVSVARDPSGRLTLTGRLVNAKGGHAFPAAPRDLAEYWLEVQFESAGGDAHWKRINQGSLLPETFYSKTGEALRKHEAWLADRIDGLGSIIAPGAGRQFSYPISEAPSGAGRVIVRLMHRRYNDAFLTPELRRGGLFTEAVELLRRTVDLPKAQTAGGR